MFYYLLNESEVDVSRPDKLMTVCEHSCAPRVCVCLRVCACVCVCTEEGQSLHVSSRIIFQIFMKHLLLHMHLHLHRALGHAELLLLLSCCCCCTAVLLLLLLEAH